MIGDIPQELSSTSESKHTKSLSLPVAALILMGAALGPVMWFNHPLFLSINGMHNPSTDKFWLALTTLGDGLLLAIFLGVFLLVNPRVTFFGISLLLISAALVHTIKLSFPVFRPVVLLDNVHVVGPVLRNGAFPSGHAAAAMSAGLAIARFYPSMSVSVTAILMALMIGLSRIFVGAHFPSDVLGGIMCATLVYIVMEKSVWAKIEHRIPSAPSIGSPAFRRIFYLEVMASLYAVSVYSYFFVELSWVGAAAAFLVLVFLTVGYCRLSSAQC